LAVLRNRVNVFFLSPLLFLPLAAVFLCWKSCLLPPHFPQLWLYSFDLLSHLLVPLLFTLAGAFSPPSESRGIRSLFFTSIGVFCFPFFSLGRCASFIGRFKGATVFLSCRYSPPYQRKLRACLLEEFLSGDIGFSSFFSQYDESLRSLFIFLLLTNSSYSFADCKLFRRETSIRRAAVLCRSPFLPLII